MGGFAMLEGRLDVEVRGTAREPEVVEGSAAGGVGPATTSLIMLLLLLIVAPDAVAGLKPSAIPSAARSASSSSLSPPVAPAWTDTLLDMRLEANSADLESVGSIAARLRCANRMAAQGAVSVDDRVGSLQDQASTGDVEPAKVVKFPQCVPQTTLISYASVACLSSSTSKSVASSSIVRCGWMCCFQAESVGVVWTMVRHTGEKTSSFFRPERERTGVIIFVRVGDFWQFRNKQKPGWGVSDRDYGPQREPSLAR
jgi:hypothetical protein